MRILPNSEQLTSVASSINLAKSYVTFLSCIADSIAEIIKSAASVQPRCLNIISAERISDPGLTLSCPAYLGAVPCVASKTAVVSPRFAPGAMPMPPT